MHLSGDIFLNDFCSVDELLAFLESNFNEKSCVFQDGFLIEIKKLDCKLFIYENHEMDDDLGVNFSEYRYWIIVDFMGFVTDGEDYENKTIQLTKSIQSVFENHHIKTVAVLDMQRLI